jgi:uncharacterized membrane protein YidH (DUF202 family)
MRSSAVTVRPYQRLGVFAGVSFLLGLFFGWVLPDLGLGYQALNTVASCVFLLASSVICSRLLWNYSNLTVTYYASGGALIASVLPIYYGIKTGSGICHLTTAKWLTVFGAFLGASLILYGFIHWIENDRSDDKGGDAAKAKWSSHEIKAMILALMLMGALYTVITQAVRCSP